jgi:hypothetical protein
MVFALFREQILLRTRAGQSFGRNSQVVHPGTANRSRLHVAAELGDAVYEFRPRLSEFGTRIGDVGDFHVRRETEREILEVIFVQNIFTPSRFSG